MIIISAENISYSVFPSAKQEVKILNDISFTFLRNSVLGISGESGSGKTTLAKILAGHFKPTSGKLTFSFPAESSTNPVQMLFQNTGSIVNPLRRINEMVSEAAFLRLKDIQKSAAEAEYLFDLLEIKKELHFKRGYELSGGEQQRSALARILAVKPEVLILDEPFAAQDVQSQLNILNLLKKIKQEYQLSVICISHNFRIISNFADSILTISNGKVSSHIENREVNKT